MFTVRERLAIVTPLFLLFALHAAASVEHWYFYYPHFDDFVHLFGGVVSGFVVYTVLKSFDVRVSSRIGDLSWMPFVVALLAVVAIGVGWEWYEFIKDSLFLSHTQPSIADTMSDLLMDTVGAAIGIIAAYASRA